MDRGGALEQAEDRRRPEEPRPPGRRHGGRNPLWAKAPLVLLRFRGLFVALAIGALLLALAAASYPLFLSATAGELVESQVEDPLVGRFGVGISYQRSRMPLDPEAPDVSGVSYRELRDAFMERIGRFDLLAPPVTGLLGPALTVASGDEEREGRMMGREGAIRHIRVVAGREGPGVWIADVIARGLGVGPGDQVRLRAGAGEVVVRVDGTYEELWTEPRTDYWRSWSREIFPQCADCPPPPEFVLTDPVHARELARRLGATDATIGWDAPAVARDLSLQDLRSLERIAATLVREASTGGKAFETFRCCGFRYLSGPRFRRTFVSLVSGAPQALRQVERRLIPVQGPVQLLFAAALLVALAVTAGAGAFAAGARRAEAGFLHARGVGPVAVAGRSALETLLPAVLGGSLGFGLAVLLVAVLGPGGPIGSGALRVAVLAAAASVPVAVLVEGAVTAAAFGRRPRRERGAPSVLRIPWELALVGTGIYLYLGLRDRGVFLVDPVHGVARPSAALLAFPVLILAGLAALAGRLGRLWLRGLRGRGTRLPHASYLALRRLAGAPGLVLLLFAGSTLSLGAFVHAQTVTRSLETTTEAKAKLFVGSDVRATVHEDLTVPADFPLPATIVTRAREAGSILPNGGRIDLLAVDPGSLAEAAYWNDRFADRPLAELTAGLGSGDPLPVIVAGGESPDRFRLQIAGRAVPVRVAGRAGAFPGSTSRHPLIVAGAEGLEAALGFDPFRLVRNNSRQLWVKGPAEEARAAAAGLAPRPYGILTARRVMDVPSIAAVVDTFGVLNILSLAAAALVAAALLMYLQARQRTQIVSHALSVRMGMDERGHRSSILQELGALLGAAYAMALALALGISLLVVPMIDPLGDIPPAPLFLPPLLPFLLVPAVLALVVWLGAVVTNRRARAANLAEVMRVAE